MLNSIIPFDHDFGRIIRDFETLTSSDFWNTIPRTLTNKKTRLKITGTLPKLDIIDCDEEKYVKIIFDVHGYNKDDFKLTVDELENKLTFRTGKLNEYDEDDDKEKKYIIKEIKQSSAQRTIEFPDQLDLTTIESKYSDGYLTCTIPYKSMNKENERELKILSKW